MLKKKMVKVIGLVVVSGLIVQSAIYAYAGIFKGQPVGNIDISAVQVSVQIENMIREQEPGEFNKNLTHYKQMLVVLNVHETYKAQIEDFLVSGKRLPDLLIACQFLNENYGYIDELSALLADRETGKTWLEVFNGYRQNNPDFIPRSFDFDYLEELMQYDGITEDDIMIADRVSQKTGLALESIIADRISGESWKSINERLGIFNAQEVLPRVPVTQEQLKQYTAGGILMEDMVVQTLVIAFKLEMDEQEAMDKAEAGYTPERFFAEVLEAKYE